MSQKVVNRITGLVDYEATYKIFDYILSSIA